MADGERESADSRDGRFVVSGDIRLWTVVRGEGRRVLVVHGGPGLDHNFVAPLGNELASSFEVWMPDLPGHGLSTRPDGKTPGLRQLEDKLANWAEHLPFRFDAVVGHSLGARLVYDLLRHGEIETSRVVLLSPPATGQSASKSSLRRAGRITPSHTGEPDFRRDVRLHIMVECDGQLPSPAREALDVANLTAIAKYQRLLANLHRQNTGLTRPFSPPCPVLVLVGGEDRTTPLEQAHAVSASIAGSRLEIIEGLGHYPFFQDATRVSDAIRAFIAQAT